MGWLTECWGLSLFNSDHDQVMPMQYFSSSNGFNCRSIRLNVVESPIQQFTNYLKRKETSFSLPVLSSAYILLVNSQDQKRLFRAREGSDFGVTEKSGNASSLQVAQVSWEDVIDLEHSSSENQCEQASDV